MPASVSRRAESTGVHHYARILKTLLGPSGLPVTELQSSVTVGIPLLRGQMYEQTRVFVARSHGRIMQFRKIFQTVSA